MAADDSKRTVEREIIVRAVTAILPVMVVFGSSCNTQAPVSSVGDSPVHQLKCSSVSSWEMCVARGTKKNCNGATSRVLNPSVDELEDIRNDGQAVPPEGSITRRTITIVCEE